jgi:hypothetical protein
MFLEAAQTYYEMVTNTSASEELLLAAIDAQLLVGDLDRALQLKNKLPHP